MLPPERFLNAVLYQLESNVPGAPSMAGLVGSSVHPKLICTSLVEGPACSCTSGPPGLNSWEVAEIWTVVSLPGLPEPNSQLCAF